ncbi:MAG TPA: MFS transporter [Gaiellaceae bacterium]|nr:MFS transporter [Gaiellaceae bacterium]
MRLGRSTPLTAAVAVAFADSSIVVLALPDLYGRFQTTIEGVSWVITAYNVAVASTALLFVFLVHRFRAAYVLGGGLVLFLAASIACAAANSLAFLIAARSVQGVGAALLLSGALPVIGARTWTLAGTYGLAVGPALGGVLTQAFDWRAIFVAQAPVAAVALLGVGRSQPEDVAIEGWRPSLRRTLPANTCLGLLFGALVGALFLAVLIVISVWSYSPIGGAAIVSALPIAALAARPLDRWLAPVTAVCTGAALLAVGLVGLALLPSASVWLLVWALLLCGAGLGLSLPVLSDAALQKGANATRSGTLTVGARHVGLVLALAIIAPLLASKIPAAGDQALLRGTAVLLDAPIGLDKKVPVALDLRSAFDKAREGETPDLAEPFDKHGAQHDSALASARDTLLGAIEATITRASRAAFFVCAGFAALALLVALLFRRSVLG